MTKQFRNAQIRKGYTVLLFILSIVSPAFFFVGAHYIGIHDGASLACAIGGVAAAICAGYCDNKIKELK